MKRFYYFFILIFVRWNKLKCLWWQKKKSLKNWKIYLNLIALCDVCGEKKKERGQSVERLFMCCSLKIYSHVVLESHFLLSKEKTIWFLLETNSTLLLDLIFCRNCETLFHFIHYLYVSLSLSRSHSLIFATNFFMFHSRRRRFWWIIK